LAYTLRAELLSTFTSRLSGAFRSGDSRIFLLYLFTSTVALITEVTARDVSRYYTQSNTYIARQSAQKLVGQRQGNERMDITKKWRTVSLRWNHSVKTDRRFRAKNRRNCTRLPIALKGNRSFTTSYLKTSLVLFDLFLPFACIGFAFLSDFYNTFLLEIACEMSVFMIDDQKISDKICHWKILLTLFALREMRIHFYNYILIKYRKLKIEKREIRRKKRQKSQIYFHFIKICKPGSVISLDYREINSAV